MNPPPEQHGYPDWQRVEQRQLEPLMRVKELAVNAQEEGHGPFYVGTTPAVTVFVEMTAQEIDTNTLTLVWAFDEKLSEPTISESFTFNEPGQYLYQQFACQAPWLFIIFSIPKLAHENKYTVVVEPNTALLSEPRRGENVLFAGEVKVGAGKTVIKPVPRLAQGSATIHLYDGLVKGAIFFVLERFVGGVWVQFDVLTFSLGEDFINAHLALPPNPLRLNFTNLTAAEVTFTAALAFP